MRDIDECSNDASPGVDAMVRLRCERSNSWFRRAFPIKHYNMSPQIAPITSPGSTENDNALVADGVCGEQVAEPDGRTRFVCTAGGLNISYVGQTIRKSKLYTPWKSANSQAPRCPRSDRAVGVSDLNVRPIP